ncbi:MAG TPA: hypothetical protein VFZ98_06395 [Vicinamibacterales bacterium]
MREIQQVAAQRDHVAERPAPGFRGGLEILEHLLHLGGNVALSDTIACSVQRDLTCDEDDLPACGNRQLRITN